MVKDLLNENCFNEDRWRFFLQFANDFSEVSFHNKSFADLLVLFESQNSGLSSQEVAARQKIFGLNKIEPVRKVTWLKQLLAQFSSPVITVLIFAAVISRFIGETIEAYAISAIVILNGLLGFFQEFRAEKALNSLQSLIVPKARVLRENSVMQVSSRDIVPGDILFLEAGDIVPADCRLATSFNLQTQEAALTGESLAVEKSAERILAASLSLGDRINMVFSGTTVLSGQAKALVIATGMKTEIGKIAAMIAQQPIEPTPLQKRLAILGKKLMLLSIFIVIAVAGLQWLRGIALTEIFIFAVSLAVAAVPEGLPAVITIALAYGLTRMAARNALIRRLPSVETLGSVTVICSDKTGTLTRNEMTVKKIVTSQSIFSLEGDGYKPEGKIKLAHLDLPIAISDHPDLSKLLRASATCNHAKILLKQQKYEIIGDPTEGALIVAALKAKISMDDLEETVHELPFDADRKMMSVIVASRSGGNLLYVKGAPEQILRKSTKILIDGKCTLFSSEHRDNIERQHRDLTSDALRVLGVAYRELESEAIFSENLEAELVFLGLVGMIDPPRADAIAAVDLCGQAGINIVMITGDHPDTGLAIAKQLGIANSEPQVKSGQELDLLSEQELAAITSATKVYARVSPAHKLRIVKSLKKGGEIVAMTGDGVNDAPAIRVADIGIAMGITGTDVTKEAAAMILVDDNFASIVSAVEEGRGIFENIENILRFLLAGNFGEISLVLFAAIAGWPTPLLAVQILWINLVTDGLPALALATEKPAQGVMKRPPLPADEAILNWQKSARIIAQGVLLSAAAIFGYWWTLYSQGSPLQGNVSQAQAVAFCICAFAQLAFAFVCRSAKTSLLKMGIFSNIFLLFAVLLSGIMQLAVIFVPSLQNVFFSEAPSFTKDTWLIIICLSLLPAIFIEIMKWLYNNDQL